MDIVLVGDTAAMTVLGYDSTVPVTVDELLVLVKAVRRGLSSPLLVGDLPVRLLRGLQRAGRRHRAALPQGGRLRRDQARGRRRHGRARTRDRGHRAYRWSATSGSRRRPPTALGGFKAQARTAERAQQMIEDALRAAGGRMLPDRLRGDPGRGRRGRDGAARGARDRHRRGRRQPTGRCSSGTTSSASTSGARRASSSATRSFAPRSSTRCAATPARCAAASSPPASTPTRSTRRARRAAPAVSSAAPRRMAEAGRLEPAGELGYFTLRITRAGAPAASGVAARGPR